MTAVYFLWKTKDSPGVIASKIAFTLNTASIQIIGKWLLAILFKSLKFEC